MTGKTQQYYRIPDEIRHARYRGDHAVIGGRRFTQQEITMLLSWAEVADKEHPLNPDETILRRRLSIEQVDLFLRSKLAD
jgi:hypothetical protein